jgi:hypothetical protein
MSISDSARKIPGVAAAEGAIAPDAVAAKLHSADSDTAQQVKRYERDHKDRAGVIQAADQRLARS